MPKSKATVEPLSKAQEEEMSSALIAKLLAEDDMLGGGGNDYYAEYSNDTLTYERYKSEDDDESYEDDSEDEGYKPKRSSNGKGKGRGRPPKSAKDASAGPSTPGKRGRKRKNAETDPAQTANEAQPQGDNTEGAAGTSTEEQAAPGEQQKTTTKKPRRPVPEGFNTGVYTEEEEKKFLEALEMFGRDWNKVTAHIGTRDAHSIRSHAQKHFIKLYRDKIPLPEKVRESGEGYTLSGKPLDPDSAAAKPYLSRGKSTTKNDNEKGSEVAKDPAADTNAGNGAVSAQQDKSNDGAAENDKTTDLVKTTEGLAVTENQQSTSNATSATPSPKPAATKQSRKSPSAKSRNSSPTKSSIPTSVYEEDGRTSYSKKKLRQTRERTTISYNQLGNDQDPLTMIKCEPFTGEPGSNISGCQPFALQVHSNVLLAMDFHAHLMSTEIIGFLAGSWDKTEKRICIKEAFPCRSLNTGQNDVNVEMDPTSAIETRQLIEEKNMVVVGWYHSHPTFAPDPSIIDIENQRNYQTLCREKCDGNGGSEGGCNAHSIPEFMEPFVGAIIGPYDPRLPGSSSVINWFYISDSRNASPAPKRLHYELIRDTSIPDEYAARLFALLDEYKNSPEKVDFAGLWRQESDENKLDKITKSLGGRMPWIKQQLSGINSEQNAQVQDIDTSAENNNEDTGTKPMEVDSDNANSDSTTSVAKQRTFVADPFLTRVREALQHW